MTTAAKKKKLHAFIDTADDHQIKAFYNKIAGHIIGNIETSNSVIKMQKLEVIKQATNDPLFLADMQKISEDFKSVS
jgi:hypothetical protein